MHYAKPHPTLVTGDWRKENAEPLPALVTGYWNGWAMPLFDRATAELVVAEQAELTWEDAPTLRWDGDVVVLFDPNYPDDGEQRIEPIEVDGVPYWDFSLGWTWSEEGGGESAAPTEPQLAAFKRARESLSMYSADGIIHEDGTHVFYVHANLGNTTDDGFGVHETIGSIAIASDGTVTVRPLPSPRDKQLAQAADVARDLAAQVHEGEDVDEAIERLGELADALTAMASGKDESPRCEQCGEPFDSHPIGDGIKTCPGDFGPLR